MEALELRLRGTLVAWCGVPGMLVASEASLIVASQSTGDVAGGVAAGRVDAFVSDMFRAQAPSLVRLARLFVDDRNAAEDLVQEAFIRLARSAHRIDDPAKAPAYLRSIVLNLTRDHNRRGLVSMRHRLPLDRPTAGLDDDLVVQDDQRRMLYALRDLPRRQRACLVLRYYDELGVDDIATTLGVSRNSVKTHLQRGLAALETLLAAEVEA